MVLVRVVEVGVGWKNRLTPHRRKGSSVGRNQGGEPSLSKRNMKKFFVIAMLGVLSGGATLQAKETSSTAGPMKALVGVPAAELPAAVAKLIASTPKEARPAVLNALLRRIAKTNPASLKHVAVAVAKQDASLAPLVAALAARALPESVGTIAAAVASAVPSRAGEILAACSHVTVVGRGALAEMVSNINPSFNAAVLAREASSWAVTTTTAAAATATGGTVLLPLPIPGDSGGGTGTVIGTDLNGNLVYDSEKPTGVTGQVGVDSGGRDIYASAP